tara:strand:- start:155 stop:1339 length:1185 start_codon:yes stop_codon:yes gene_type:complete
MKLINDELQRLLIELLKENHKQDKDTIISGYEKFGADRLREISENNFSDLTVSYNLINTDYLNKHEKKYWESIYESYIANEDSQWYWLGRVISELKSAGHEILLLKDTGLSLNVYPTRCYRRHVDIDILVLKETYNIIDPILKSMGFMMSNDDNYNRPSDYMAVIHGQKKAVRYLDGNKLELEFHLRPHAGRWIRPRQEPSPSDLFKNSQRVNFNNELETLVLADDDNLIYECIHATKHFLVLDRIVRNYMDIDKIIAKGSVNWRNVIDITKKHEVVLPVKMALLVTKELFDSDIPENVFNRLNSSNWREKYFKNWIIKHSVFDKNPQKSIGQLNRFLFYLLMTDSWAHTFYIIFRVFFMPSKHLKIRYQFSNNLLIPYFYIYNFLIILIKRKL